MSSIEQAVTCFEGGFNCSQAVCSTYAEQFGLNRDLALKIAAGFGGGIGRLAQTCGAVTGAFMIIGLKHGATQAEDKESKENTYEQIQKFAEEFAVRNKTIVCRELLDCDISTPEGRVHAKEHNLFSTVCPKLVRSAAEILEEMGI